MTTRRLNDIILDGGVRSVKFFNGRLLSGEDLSKEQEAQRIERRRLGQAIGSGVVSGLEVTEPTGISSDDAPVLNITPGLAINREGQTLALTDGINLSLVKSNSTANTSNGTAATFGDCLPPGSGVYVAGAGLWLLTIFPADTTEGRALVSGLGNVDAGCNVRYVVDAVQFRLINLNLEQIQVNLGDLNRLRNQIAYRCFGIAETATVYSDLFGPEIHSYGIIDDLRPNRLADCEVPLALIYYTAKDGLVFLDQWAVRRRVVAPEASSRWEFLTGERRKAEAEAMYHQFQAHLEDLRGDPFTTITLKASQHFRYLPAAGIVPLSRSITQAGFNEHNFFDGITTRGVVRDATTPPIIIEAARVESLLRDSFAYPPIDLDSRVMLWVYHVRENVQAGQSVQQYVTFASGHMPYIGDAHFNVNRWSLSNFAQWLENRGE